MKVRRTSAKATEKHNVELHRRGLAQIRVGFALLSRVKELQRTEKPWKSLAAFGLA